jgi:hypothetical protein
MRQFTLFFASAGLITAFFLLPPNRAWFKDRVLTYYKEFDKQRKTMGAEKRMTDRFGNYYSVSRQIAGAIQQRAGSGALLLMPSTAYFKKYGIQYHVPEPVVFYYFTQLSTVWPNSANAKNANWYVHVVNGKVVADSVRERKSFLDTLAAFNKFEISL